MDYPNPHRDRANLHGDSATRRPSHRKGPSSERSDPNANRPIGRASGFDANRVRSRPGPVR